MKNKILGQRNNHQTDQKIINVDNEEFINSATTTRTSSPSNSISESTITSDFDQKPSLIMKNSDDSFTRPTITSSSQQINNHNHGQQAPQQNEDDQEPENFPQQQHKVYKIRHLLLLIFMILSMSNSFQWIQYAIIETIVNNYYNVTTFWINCTSVVYMISYIIGIIPATYLQNRYGLRICLIIGSFLNAFGSWIKCLSLNRENFYRAMIGQTFTATAQLFILNMPPVLAAYWFPSNEVTRATAYGVFGNQVGIALGFLIPPLLMPTLPENVTTLNDSQIDRIQHGFRILLFGMATITTLIFFLILVIFKDRPKQPPSQAQALKLDMEKRQSKQAYLDSIKKLFQNNNFVLLFISYGLNVGVFYALSTVLSQMITKTMGQQYLKDAGYMGLVITISGIVGAIVCGYILGWSGKYKLVTLIIYLFSLLGTIGFTFSIEIDSLQFLYASCTVLGFFMTGYLPIGFEFALEVSYPQSESICSGLVNASAQIFGIILTFGSSSLIEKFGAKWANIAYVMILIIGFLLTFLVKNDLRRQNSKL